MTTICCACLTQKAAGPEVSVSMLLLWACTVLWNMDGRWPVIQSVTDEPETEDWICYTVERLLFYEASMKRQ